MEYLPSDENISAGEEATLRDLTLVTSQAEQTRLTDNVPYNDIGILESQDIFRNDSDVQSVCFPSFLNTNLLCTFKYATEHVLKCVTY